MFQNNGQTTTTRNSRGQSISFEVSSKADENTEDEQTKQSLLLTTSHVGNNQNNGTRRDSSSNKPISQTPNSRRNSNYWSGRARTLTDASGVSTQINTTCGIGRWRPQWLQPFSSPLFFMLNMGLVGVIQGMSGALFFASISTFEKRYAFDSKISGVIMIADNFAELFLDPIVGYIGVRFNRARLIALGEVILALSCFVTASPYLIYGHAEHLINREQRPFPLMMSSFFANQTSSDSSSFQLCTPSGGANPADDAHCTLGSGATVWPAVALLVFGSFCRGIGYTCYFVIGLPYLDDNIKKNKSPLYIAIMHSVRMLGPAFGYMLSSFCLKFYENPFVDPGFGRSDPRFVGAWWLSFVITGVILFICALPMFCFPLQFKSATVQTVEMRKRIAQSGGSWGALKRVVTNPLLMCYMIANIFRFNGLSGFTMFNTKYIESQYRQSAASASFLTGFSSFMPIAIGIMLGGAVIAYLKPRPRIIFLLVFLTESVLIFSIGSGLVLGCDPINIAGGYNHRDEFSPRSPCNQDCGCSTRVFTPICGTDRRTTFFSPCHAGCSGLEGDASGNFGHCGCLDPALGPQQASKGYCELPDKERCSSNLFKYVSFITAGSIISSFARTPNSLIALRSVDPMDKGFAIGFTSTLMAIFAFMQYPIIFGHIADAACLIWERKCGRTGNCWLYDNDRFRKLFHGAAMGFVALASLADFCMIFFADRVQNFYDEEDEAEGEQKEVENGGKRKSIQINQNGAGGGDGPFQGTEFHELCFMDEEP